MTRIATAPFEPTIGSPATFDVISRNSSGQFVNIPALGVEIALNTPVAGANDTVVGTTNRYYHHFTMPTTRPLYIVTGFEVLNGTVVNGNHVCALVTINADPPTLGRETLLAMCAITAQSGAAGVQRTSQVSSCIIPGGTLVSAFVVSSSATGRYGTTTVSSENNLKAVAANADIPTGNNTSWTGGTEEPYIKVYGKPIL